LRASGVRAEQLGRQYTPVVFTAVRNRPSWVASRAVTARYARSKSIMTFGTA
jgi:hypothetical protein